MSDAEQEYLPLEEHSVEPEDVVKRTQRLRHRIVDELTDNGRRIPDDPLMLLNVLRDMDQSALTTRKLNIEEKGANDGRKALETFERLESLLGGKDPFRKSDKEVIALPSRKSDVYQGVNAPEVELNPGEEYQGEQVLKLSDYLDPES